MDVELKYNVGQRVLCIPEKADVSFLRPSSMSPLRSIGDVLETALADPLGCENFDKLARHIAPKRVSIAVPDETRQMPVRKILGILLKKIYSALPDLNPSALTIVIGAGLHPPSDRETQERIANVRQQISESQPLPAGLRIGRERYEQMLARLTSSN